MSMSKEETSAAQAFGGKPYARAEVTIKKCSNPNAWYKNMVGKKIKIRYYGTFGCWDEEGRWVDFYDLL